MRLSEGTIGDVSLGSQHAVNGKTIRNKLAIVTRRAAEGGAGSGNNQNAERPRRTSRMTWTCARGGRGGASRELCSARTPISEISVRRVYIPTVRTVIRCGGVVFRSAESPSRQREAAQAAA